MKARASNLMIGSTTLVAIAAAFVGFLGFQKIHGIAQRGPLRIVFEGSASGLRQGGNVNFDGVQVGEIKSLKLDNPRKVVALAMVDSSAPIRKDTIVGLEFQGLTGVAAISLTGGAAAAPPVPLDWDGIPTLTADLSEVQSIRDTLHSVDRILVGNQAMLKDTLLNFETYTATLASKGDAIDSIIRKADGAFESFDSAMAKIDNIVPGLGSGSADELYDKVRTIRELAESFNKRSGAFMEEGRRSLLDISQAAVKVTRKFDPQTVSGENPPPPWKPNQKRQSSHRERHTPLAGGLQNPVPVKRERRDAGQTAAARGAVWSRRPADDTDNGRAALAVFKHRASGIPGAGAKPVARAQSDGIDEANLQASRPAGRDQPSDANGPAAFAFAPDRYADSSDREPAAGDHRGLRHAEQQCIFSLGRSFQLQQRDIGGGAMRHHRLHIE